jgi:hypothetical protein
MSEEDTISQPFIQSRLNKTRSDKWVFIFKVPEPMRSMNTIGTIAKGKIDSEAMQFSLIGCNIPSITVKGITQKYASGNLYVSSHSKDPFDLLTIKFTVDNRFANYVTIYEWLNMIHDESYAYPDPKNLTGTDFNFKNYWTNVGIVGLDEYNVPKIMFTFTQAFPTQLSGWEFDYTRDDEISCSAQFAFSQIHISYPKENSIGLL